MIGRESARSFVQRHGTDLQKQRLEALLDGHLPQDLPPSLEAARNDDGGLAFDLRAGRPSALNTTAQALRWLSDLHLRDHPVSQAALQFLRDRQTSRGIWREHADLQRFTPPLWMDPESPAADIYTTALCAGTLAVVSQVDDLQIDRAVTWLQTQQGRDGLLSGFRTHSSWLALPAFAHTLGHETRSTRRLVAGLGAALSPEWPAAMVAWLLQALLDAGYTRRTEIVNRAWHMLSDAQQPDGSFGDGEDDDPVETALRALDVAYRLQGTGDRGQS